MKSFKKFFTFQKLVLILAGLLVITNLFIIYQNRIIVREVTPSNINIDTYNKFMKDCDRATEICTQMFEKKYGKDYESLRAIIEANNSDVKDLKSDIESIRNSLHN